MKRIALVALLLAASSGGCVSGRLHMGRTVAVEKLEGGLTIGKSTADDVRRVLGEPDGRGEALLPILAGPRTVWSYYYEFSDLSGLEVEHWGRTLLWIYLDGEVYDGYLWFSSVPEQRSRAGPQGEGSG
jgi:hypothetical protein